ncbi:hypothetical protein UY3_18021 [Chelonia mydas]|uniref:Myb/SANT-like DNA-binding domain-containing protein n=1 Tax=Chelonia mydas TaxID=8469 RepID=M7AQ74_CHEMY|nr:hypothetical protein UY3_18021 [Chelonia mydas]
MASSSVEVTMESQNCKRAPAWTEREVLDLIAVWEDESVLSELRSKRRNAKIFEKISKGMKDRGKNRDPQLCFMKIKELRQAYQKTKEANGCSRAGIQGQNHHALLQCLLASYMKIVGCEDKICFSWNFHNRCCNKLLAQGCEKATPLSDASYSNLSTVHTSTMSAGNALLLTKLLPLTEVENYADRREFSRWHRASSPDVALLDGELCR